MTRDTPEAVLAAALFDVLTPSDRGSLTADPRRREYWEGRAAAILAALPPGWCGHERTAGLFTELSDSYTEAEVEIARLTRELDASRTLAAAEYADAVPVDAERHEPGDSHQYAITCKVCGERGTIRLTVDPETALAPAPSEP